MVQVEVIREVRITEVWITEDAMYQQFNTSMSLFERAKHVWRQANWSKESCRVSWSVVAPIDVLLEQPYRSSSENALLNIIAFLWQDLEYGLHHHDFLSHALIAVHSQGSLGIWLTSRQGCNDRIFTTCLCGGLSQLDHVNLGSNSHERPWEKRI